MDSVGAVGACLEHPERTGTPCLRCGTFRCGACLADGLCPACRVHARTLPVGIAAPMVRVLLGVGVGLFAQAVVLGLFFVVAAL